MLVCRPPGIRPVQTLDDNDSVKAAHNAHAATWLHLSLRWCEASPRLSGVTKVRRSRNLSSFCTGRAAVLLVVGGCQQQMLSDDRMTQSIAGTLGVPPSDITLSDRRTDGPTNTYVTARVRNGGSYACTVNGGGLLAAGIVNPPTRNPVRR